MSFRVYLSFLILILKVYHNINMQIIFVEGFSDACELLISHISIICFHGLGTPSIKKTVAIVKSLF